ncbi:MAG TPA: exodeoxyribonuclease VII large subunit [Pirellulales bacterium]|jgi:exodeoxyribonuclease VII large subunit|nr:exodeoxyribonuclease VII large subunit [Pirellulales bacterium]
MASDDLYSTVDQPAAPVLSVSQLTEQIKGVLEGHFPAVWVSGEISNFSRPQSGHCYLTLKDDQAQIRAVMWRTAASRVRFDLDDGLEVNCQGYLDVYAPRGSYQLVIQQIEPKGLGALERALRVLRARLAAEGLFDAARKRPLPRFPRRIAVVTSPTGAAIRDFLEVVRRRFRGVDILVVPVRVQGEGAAAEIAAAIALVNQMAVSVDVMVVGRGGGSLEDLWAFNEEVLVRAIHGSRIPVVSAVGHEIDVTLADLVADMRALTPSDAAARVVPDVEELAAFLNHQQQRLAHALGSRLTSARARLDTLADNRVFRRPLERGQLLARRLDELAARAMRAVDRRLETAQGRATAIAGRLESLSPLAVLARGYSLTTQLDNGRLVRSARAVQVGQQVRTRLADGGLVSRVERVETEGIEN